MTSRLEFWVQMFTICFQKSPKTTLSRLFRGVGGVCIFLKIDRATDIIFGKLGEIKFKFLRNLKFELKFEDELESEKKARRGRGLALDPRLDPSILQSFNSQKICFC
jgi:hypothetical protein